MPPGTRPLGRDPRARLEAAIADINRHHGKTKMLELVEEGYNFRNTYIAHEKTEQLTYLPALRSNGRCAANLVTGEQTSILTRFSSFAGRPGCKKRAEGKRHNQAIRALGRHICRVIFKMLSQERPYRIDP